MPRQPAPSLMAVLGLDQHTNPLYERVRAQSGREVVSIAETLRRTPDELLEELAPLLGYGVARVDDGRLFVDSPLDGVVRVLREAAATAAQAHEQLADMAEAVPILAARAAGPRLDEVEDLRPIDGEVTAGGRSASLVRSLIVNGRGDLRWLRPDRFDPEREEEMLEALREAVAQGRRARAVYTVRALTEARGLLVARAAAGEEVRVLPEVPTRMLIVGDSHAALPEPLGDGDEPRSLIRQRGIVQALTMWFDLLWERAAPVPDLERGDGRTEIRRFLLQQLAEGAQDEQIARRLGVSLRTVRRRVADLLTDLGADSRFQAGAEAVRRGWL